MAGQYLADLPSRGFFSTPANPPSNLDGLRVYICDHDTAPPEDQLIRTDPTNILIRSLTLKKAKPEPKLRDSKRKGVAENGKGKRPAERLVDDKLPVKKSNNVTVSSQKGSGVTRTVNGIGLHEKRKCNHTGHTKVIGAFVVSSSRHKSIKKTRKDEQKPKTSYLRTSNVRGKEKEIDSLNNSENLDSRDKLIMVDESGSSYAEVIAKKDSPRGPGRDAVLRACVVTSGCFAAIALTIRQVSHICSEAGLPFPDCAEAMPYTLEWSHAEMIAVLVVLISSCRQLLLIFWPEFAKSSQAANQQVLGSLDTWDYVVVSFLPGISEGFICWDYIWLCSNFFLKSHCTNSSSLFEQSYWRVIMEIFLFKGNHKIWQF